jgi:hypothetical protein
MQLHKHTARELTQEHCCTRLPHKNAPGVYDGFEIASPSACNSISSSGSQSFMALV